jgi:hypothetical protein
MNLNLLLSILPQTNLYDLYVYKLKATISNPKEMLDSMTNETLIFLPRIMGLKGLIVEQRILNTVTATATEYPFVYLVLLKTHH